MYSLYRINDKFHHISFTKEVFLTNRFVPLSSHPFYSFIMHYADYEFPNIIDTIKITHPYSISPLLFKPLYVNLLINHLLKQDVSFYIFFNFAQMNSDYRSFMRLQNKYYKNGKLMNKELYLTYLNNLLNRGISIQSIKIVLSSSCVLYLDNLFNILSYTPLSVHQESRFVYKIYSEILSILFPKVPLFDRYSMITPKYLNMV